VRFRWKQFEKELRARTGIYDARRGMSFWQKVDHFLNSAPDVPFWLGRTLVSLCLAPLVFFNSEFIVAHPGVWMAIASLWGLLWAIGQAFVVKKSAQSDPVYRTLWMLPLSAECIFRRLVGRALSGSLWLFFELFLVYAILAAASQQHLGYSAGAILCVTLQTGCSGILTLLLLAVEIKPERLLWSLVWAITVFGIFCLFPGNEPLFAAVVTVCNPLGWINGVFVEGWVSGNSSSWWGMLPLLALVATLPFSIRSIRRLNHNGTFRIFHARPANFLLMGEKETVARVEDEAEQRRQIRTGDFLQPFSWNTMGLVERLVGRILSPQEQVIAAILLNPAPRTRLFFGIVAYLALYLAANTLIPIWTLDQFAMTILRFNRSSAITLGACLASLILFTLICLNTLSLFFWIRWPEWTHSDTRPTVGPSHRSFRLLPVSYWEADKVIAKINSLVFLLLLPPALILSFTPLCQAVLKQSGQGSVFMPKCLALLWSGSLLLSSLNLIPSLQDGFKYWRSFLKSFWAFAAWFSLGVGWLFSRSLVLDCGLGAIIILLTVGWFGYSGAQYCQGSFGRTRP